ncbi:MAG: hypothetical protein ACT4OZ_00100 [Gemmatimonadota bacterium]
MTRRVVLALDLLVLLLVVGTGAAGALQLPGEFRSPTTPWQKLVSWFEVLYVIGAAGVLLGWKRRATWTGMSAVMWAVGCIGAGTVASWAYGGAPVQGVIFAFLGLLAVCALVVWYVAKRTRARIADLPAGPALTNHGGNA